MTFGFKKIMAYSINVMSTSCIKSLNFNFDVYKTWADQIKKLFHVPTPQHFFLFLILGDQT